jgi:hypothetical protein
MPRHGSHLFLLSSALPIFPWFTTESLAQGCFISAPSVFDTLHPGPIAMADFNLDSAGNDHFMAPGRARNWRRGRQLRGEDVAFRRQTSQENCGIETNTRN